MKKQNDYLNGIHYFDYSDYILKNNNLMQICEKEKGTYIIYDIKNRKIEFYNNNMLDKKLMMTFLEIYCFTSIRNNLKKKKIFNFLIIFKTIKG